MRLAALSEAVRNEFKHRKPWTRFRLPSWAGKQRRASSKYKGDE